MLAVAVARAAMNLMHPLYLVLNAQNSVGLVKLSPRSRQTTWGAEKSVRMLLRFFSLSQLLEVFVTNEVYCM